MFDKEGRGTIGEFIGNHGDRGNNANIIGTHISHGNYGNHCHGYSSLHWRETMGKTSHI